MNIPVEATIHLNHFEDEREVRKLLKSHGFTLTDLGGGQVRVVGYFSQLKAVKVRLEQLVEPKTTTKPNSFQPGQNAASGAISKHDKAQSRTNRWLPRDSRLPSPTASAFSKSQSLNRHQALPGYPSPFPPQQDPLLRRGVELFVIDADVFRYADCLMKNEVETILMCHNVQLKKQEDKDSFILTLLGKSSKIAAFKLQSLLIGLSKTLRTQEVLRRDVGQDGEALLRRIQSSGNAYDSVLVRVMSDRLHLIGPSTESYQLKQKLLEDIDHQSVRTGRTYDRSFRQRSSSEPPAVRKTDEIKKASADDLLSSGASGYTPPNHEAVKQEAAQPKGGALRRLSQSFRVRSRSESRPRKEVPTDNGVAQEGEDTPPPRKSTSKFLSQLFTVSLEAKDIRQRFKKMKNKK